MVTQVIKRNGRTVKFAKPKIVNAILKAWRDVGEVNEEAEAFAAKIATEIENMSVDVLSVESIHDIIERKLMASSHKDVAKEYIEFRQLRQIARETGKTYNSILDLVEMQNQEVKEENSNKNAVVASTQRDYIAGEVSKDITNRILLPKDIVEAHKNGEIHFHDADYFIERIFNCCLINLEDMLQNGTVINKTLIEKPHSFRTACTVATQIIAVVASGQYGGSSISLAHLAPFVDESRQRIKQRVTKELEHAGLLDVSEEQIDNIVEQQVMNEIKDGIQVLQYQINTLNTSNGQTPFVTVYMYLGEVGNSRTKQDFAMIIHEVLRQRIEGVKNEKGVWITPAFPKLIYVLEKDNIAEDSPYWYLTQLAAKCTAKRLVPDYISEKVMLELKGDVYPCMGLYRILAHVKSFEPRQRVSAYAG